MIIGFNNYILYAKSSVFRSCFNSVDSSKNEPIKMTEYTSTGIQTILLLLDFSIQKKEISGLFDGITEDILIEIIRFQHQYEIDILEEIIPIDIIKKYMWSARVIKNLYISKEESILDTIRKIKSHRVL